MTLTLRVLPGELTIVRLPAASSLPTWLPNSESTDSICSVTRTNSELSLICRSSSVPPNLPDCEPNWRAFRVESKLEFSAVGILASILNPLAAAGINILSISTFDTDYILVPAAKLSQALAALSPHFEIIRTVEPPLGPQS